VWGLELNKKNCSYAVGMLGNTILDKDLMEAGFKSGMFDVVYMRDVIEHLPNPREIMREINRILKPGGMVFIDTHNIDSLVNAITRERHTVIFGFEHPVHWSPRSLAYLLRNTGFKVMDVRFQSMDFTVACLLSYCIEPTFTTILPWRNLSFVKLILKILRKPFTLYPLKWMDEKWTPRTANMLKRGSTMKVFASKIIDS
jgi:SAM-dependent methyltransferase